jgi:hypothetical protein
MAESLTLTALRNKRDDIERAIALYQRKIKSAQRDLAHVNATMRLFEIGERSQFPVYVDTLRLFRRGEIVAICKTALAKEGPLDTRELAVRVIRAKGMDANDTVLRQSIALRIVQALRLQAKRGRVAGLPKRQGVRVWMAVK